ncbi:MAG: ISAs1 family transposase [Lachnospiraceae bacterium]|nr:ISAs1 family transposase [Lachnospiraceae bacterium]
MLLAIVCGATSYNKIEMFGIAKEAWLREFLTLENGIPSAYTFRSVMMMIDSEELHKRFIEWVRSIATEMSGVVAVDGKTVRRSKGENKKPAHIVSAFAKDSGIVLGEIACEEKSNEITAIPKLLKLLMIKGCIVTIDAMGTQTDIAATIIDREADYVLSLKENQPSLYEDVSSYIEEQILKKSKEDLPEEEYYISTDNKHGRNEIREYYICNDIEWLEHGKWKGMTGFGVCVSTVTEHGSETPVISKNYAIYSVKDMTAKQFAKCKRGHWSIENSLHWVLDMSFREDESRVREGNGAENFNILRHLAFNLLKLEQSKKTSLTNKQFLCALDTNYLMKVLDCACS